MSHVVLPWAQRSPDAPALLEGTRTLSYAELASAIAESERWLRGAGVQPGDRVMLLGENSIALAVLALAIGGVDAWPLVVNARISEREVDAIRTHSGARAVLCTSATSSEAARHAKRLELRNEVIPGLGSVAVSALATDALAERVSQDAASQVGALIYTSGTTGAPKGVMLSHRSVMFTAAIGGILRSFEPDDHVYGVLPMSHIVGFSSVLIGTLMSGACLELVPRFAAEAALQALKSGRITRFQGVPTMYQRLLEASTGEVECPNLRSIGVAGAPLDLTLKQQTEAAFGLPLHNGYGITECSPTISFTRMGDPRADTTVGPVIPGVDVRLVGQEGAEVPSGEVGELHVKGPNVMLGYYKAPELTSGVIDANGWFNTGDLARFDGDYLHIAGRTKELIIRSGFNVYPPEVEAVLATHPAVAACAVVGRKVPGNEEVVAFVQLREGEQATSEQIADYVGQRLAPYKRPAEVRIKDALPATTAGKILKHELAKEAEQPSA
ncbi:class I adenylate-forming enzyme family protein [Variovorax sp. YR216]|uniref:class I adenylate-forming enzyme family protein n=1 Tax=Variovorax sp. YR216 TaxID=1882828 RepID=UPI00210DBC90|nr:AMP-binding protein [Variovorax sp. YR216]